MEFEERTPWARLLRPSVGVTVVAGWVVYAFVQAGFIELLRRLAGQPAYGLPAVLRWSLTGCTFWIVATPLVVWLAARFPVSGSARIVHLALHGAFAVAMHFLFAASMLVLREAPQPAPLAMRFVDGMLLDLVLYSVMVAITHAFLMGNHARVRREQALVLRSQLAESRLQALTLQLPPHFLFNALHAISELVYRDARQADQAITRLAELLRKTMTHSAQLEGTLEEELQFLDTYAELERLRLGGTSRLVIDVPPELLRLVVPVLILQPVVENAFRHGIRSGGGSHVRVAGCVANGTLRLTVTDDGPGFGARIHEEGVGLRNTRERLESLYGNRQSLHRRDRPGGGAVVELCLPAHGHPAADSERSGPGTFVVRMEAG